MSFSPLPPSPSRKDPVNFNDRADALFPALANFVEEANSLIPGETAAGLAQFLYNTGTGKGAGIVGFAVADAGAVRRTVEDKLRDVISVLDFDGVDKTGAMDSTAGIQAALTAASARKATLFFPPGTYKVTAALTAGNATLAGNGARCATINYTGTGTLFGSVIEAYGLRFLGPGKTSTARCFNIQAGYRTEIRECHFDGWGTAVDVSGSGQVFGRNIFINCGTGVHVVNYPNGDFATTFTSYKNWYENCNNGLWLEAANPSFGFVTCCSRDDVFQVNTGHGLRLTNVSFPFLLVNPHTEQNSAVAGRYALRFDNSNVIWYGGYQMAGDVNLIDSLSRVTRYSGAGALALARWQLSNANGSVVALEYDPTTNTTTLPCSSGAQSLKLSGGGYSATNAARIEMFGGVGDNTFRYGTFLQSLRTHPTSNGFVFSIGAIVRGASNDTFNTLINVDDNGNLYPTGDNAQSLGKASPNRWAQIYSGTTTISSSDLRLKTQIGEIPDEWLDAWQDVDYIRCKFVDAVAVKGDGARWHVGVIAQRVEEAFAARGLDARELGLLCWDSWPEHAEIRDSKGAVLQEARPAGDRYGVRYEEALVLEAALQRRITRQLVERVAAIEGGAGSL